MNLEYGRIGEEIDSPKAEYTAPSSEYYIPSTEYWDDKVNADKQKHYVPTNNTTKKKRKKKLRKMTYLTASAVAIVTISQASLICPCGCGDIGCYCESTSEDSDPHTTFPETQEDNTYEFVWPHVNGFQGSNQQSSTSDQQESSNSKFAPTEPEISIHEPESQQAALQLEPFESLSQEEILLWQMPDEVEDWRAAHGNIIPVKINGLWGLWDYFGNEILPPTYPENYISANNQGYCIMNDNAYAYVLNPNGDIIYQTDYSSMEIMRITEDNIIFCQSTLSGSSETEDYVASISYVSPSGDIIYTNSYADDYHDSCKAYPISDDGYGMIYNSFYDDIGNGNVITYIYSDGSVNTEKEYMDIYEKTDYIPTNSEIGINGWWNGGSGSAQIYYDLGMRGYNGGISQGFVALNADSTPSVISFIDEPDYYSLPYYFDTDLTPDGSADISLFSPDSYFWNGQYFYSYGKKIVMTQEDESGNQYSFLVDLKWDDLYFDTKLTRNDVSALFDGIYINHAKYIPAKNDGVFFYIDWDGNVVSDTYLHETYFTPEGYALVMTTDTTASIINERFEIVYTIEDVESVGTAGDIFYITRNDEDYYFYYGNLYKNNTN